MVVLLFDGFAPSLIDAVRTPTLTALHADGDLILSARPPYFIEDIASWPWWVQWLGAWGPEILWAQPVLKATHGYPPETPGVQGMLYAWGAGIAKGREVSAVRAIDVHPTITHLLGIASGSPVDGAVARGLLAP